MALTREAIPSPNYSSRGGGQVRLIVLHTAEGARTYRDLGAFFGNRANQVSSHVGIDDTPGTIGEYVRRDGKAWTAANFNPVAVQVELCAFAAWPLATWRAHPNMLRNVAAWIAEEAANFNIPITKLTPAQAQGSGRGVCQHRDLGANGGGHHDCGDAFPIDDVLAMAKGGQAATPPAAPAQGTAPPFPFPQSDYLGVQSGDPHCHSSGDAVSTWQQQMVKRNWQLDVDGDFGPTSKAAATQFQRNKGLNPDGLVGATTWAATWNAK